MKGKIKGKRSGGRRPKRSLGNFRGKRRRMKYLIAQFGQLALEEATDLSHDRQQNE